MKHEAIDTITLHNVLPRVFQGEQIPPSQVWQTDITFRRGQNYVIEAPSGTGKSSLCAYIYGNRRDYLGSIHFDRTDISGITPARWQLLRRRTLAYLPQELDLFPELTAMQNITLKASLTDAVSIPQIEEWLHTLSIDSRSHFPVGKMSIGQQQRVAIIRAICQPFSFLLIDEPVSHLDADNNARAAQIILQAARAQGAGIIATSVGNRIGINVDTLLHL